MREMRDSGVEWIGMIPADWILIKLKYSVVLKTDKSTVNENYIGLENVESWTGCLISTDEDIPDSSESKIVSEGDILFGSLRPYLAKCYIAREAGSCSTEFFVMSVTKYLAKFLFYLLTSPYFIDTVDMSTYGAKMPRTSWEYMGNLYLPHPTIEKQQYIIDFLDAKCAELAALASSIQSKIDTLEQYKRRVITDAVTKGIDKGVEMKDSGVEWIGEIPQKWSVVPTKYIFNIFAGATPQSTNENYWDGDIAWITPADYKTSDIYISKGSRSITDIGYDSCSANIVPKGSIIFSKRAPIGQVAISSEELCTNQGCLSCVPKDNGIDSKYYYYSMSALQEVFEFFGAGTTFNEMSASSFMNLKIQWPSQGDQKRIVDYLDAKCAEIDDTISIYRRQLETLDEYKRSLIYEYVTGKKEVPASC